MLNATKQGAKTLSNATVKFPLPERFKGTFLEKWTNYWRGLYADYKSMAVDLVTDIQQKPRKALFYTSTLGIGWQLSKNNPDEIDFREDFKRYSNEALLVSEDCRNPKAEGHFKYIERCYNEGLMRRVNLGVASFIWADDFDEACDLYRTKCEYTQPSYFSVPGRVVDIGFMGKWWNIYRKFQDFDVKQ